MSPRTGWKRLVLLTLLVWPIIVAPAWAANTYEIQATVVPLKNEIAGQVSLTFINETPSPLPAILVTIKDGRILEARGPDDKALPVGAGLDENSKRIALGEPLAPGGSIRIRLAFSGTYPLDSAGYHLANGAWHPKALIFREGEFSAAERQADSYAVTLTFPAGDVVATSGELVQRTSPSAGVTELRYRAKDVTEFGIVSSPDFLETVREVKGVRIRSLYFPGREKWGVKLAEYAARIIPFYIETFGYYPQNALSILPGNKRSTGGYPAASNVVVVHDTLDNAGEAFAEWITAHEIGHQYWGWDGVIDSGRYYHWPGLALGIYMDRLYTEAFIPERAKAHRNFVDQYLGGVARGLDTTMRRTWAEIDALPFDFNNIVAHGKSYAVVRMLEGLMGPERFLNFTKSLLARFRGRYLSPDEFQRLAGEAAGSKLDWFFRDWFEGNAVLSYEIETVRPTSSGVEVVVQRTGTAGMPMDLELLFEDGTKVRKKIAREGKTQTVLFETPARPRQARLDPDRFMALHSPEGGHVWGRKAQVLDVRLPEKLNWGTNFLALKVRNQDDRPHEVEVHIQTNHLTLPRGWGYQTQHSVPAGEETSIDRDFILVPFPGRERVRLSVWDVAEEIQIFGRTYFAEFPLVNRDSSPLVLPPDLRRLLKSEKEIYPRFTVTERGRFVFYFLEGDAYLEKMLPEIAGAREKAYTEIVGKINPGFDGRVAVYFLPDADSKRVYFGHVGLGWAPGENILVEIFNEQDRVDPNHELVHIIAASRGNPPALFSEGLATYFQVGQKWDGYHVDAWSKAFAERGMLWPLLRLFTFVEIGSEDSKPRIAYPQAGSVINYLAGRYGFEKVMRLYKALEKGSSEAVVKANETRLLETIGVGIEDLEKGWLESLKKTTAESLPEDKIQKRYPPS